MYISTKIKSIFKELFSNKIYMFSPLNHQKEKKKTFDLLLQIITYSTWASPLSPFLMHQSINQINARYIYIAILLISMNMRLSIVKEKNKVIFRKASYIISIWSCIVETIELKWRRTSLAFVPIINTVKKKKTYIYTCINNTTNNKFINLHYQIFFFSICFYK